METRNLGHTGTSNFYINVNYTKLILYIRYGSILSDANNLVRNFNPTVVQVAASVLGAYKWLIQNPNKGVCWPDNLPHKFVSFFLLFLVGFGDYIYVLLL